MLSVVFSPPPPRALLLHDVDKRRIEQHAASLAVDQIAGHGEDPSLEIALLVDLRAVFPQPQEKLLSDVLGQRLVEQRLAGEVVDIPAPPFVDGVESLAVASFQAPQQLFFRLFCFHLRAVWGAFSDGANTTKLKLFLSFETLPGLFSRFCYDT